MPAFVIKEVVKDPDGKLGIVIGFPMSGRVIIAYDKRNETTKTFSIASVQKSSEADKLNWKMKEV